MFQNDALAYWHIKNSIKLGEICLHYSPVESLCFNYTRVSIQPFKQTQRAEFSATFIK